MIKKLDPLSYIHIGTKDNLINICIFKVVQSRWIQALFCGAQGQNQKQGTQTGIQEVPLKHQETLLCCAGDGALVQAAQQVFRVSLLRNVQNLHDIVLGNLFRMTQLGQQLEHLDTDVPSNFYHTDMW